MIAPAATLFVLDLVQHRPACADELKPADAAAMLGFARICDAKKLHAAAAWFAAQACQAEPNLADHMHVQNRYKATWAAALASRGQCKVGPIPSRPFESSQAP
jgi:hypothetical protein